MSTRLLLVDDSEDIRHLFQWRLRDLGAEYHAVEGVNEGWDLAHKLQPELVLLDVNLGEESGLDLCRRLRAHPATAHLAIAMFSAAEDAEAQILSLEAGADDHLAKNLPGPLLLARCRAVLRRGERLRRFAAEIGIDPLTGAWTAERLEQFDTSGLHVQVFGTEEADPIVRSARLAALGEDLRRRFGPGWVVARGEGDTLVVVGPTGGAAA